MTRVRILNAEPERFSDRARAVLQQLGDLDEQALDRAALLNALSDYEVLIVRLGVTVDRELLDAGRRLRAIVTAATGTDHIDVDYANDHGIAVLSLKGEVAFLRSVTATAEHTWALLLALVRHIPFAFDHVRAGGWDRDLFRGRQLRGLRLGVVGLGRVGLQVAAYGCAFGMRVAAYDPYLESWPDGIERVDSLHDLAAASDAITLHVPLDPTTQGLVSAAVLAAMTPGAVLVNTSRGAVLDERALLDALHEGRLAGAALDVAIGERGDLASSQLLGHARTHDTLIVTPHIGGATAETMEATELFMAHKLECFLREGVDS